MANSQQVVQMYTDRQQAVLTRRIQLLAEITAEIVALQNLVCRPGAWGLLGAPVAAGNAASKQMLLQVLVQLVTYMRELNERLAATRKGFREADLVTAAQIKGSLGHAPSRH